MEQIYKKAYAKINLFLEVLFRRDDGFHEIRTVMQAISLFDEIFVSAATKDKIEVHGAGSDVPIDENNIVIKALKKFRERTWILTPVSVRLIKNIPSQAGLGGGSSDCASMLDALNDLFGKPLAVEHLASIGAELGSDVPFFFYLPSAVCTGRGEVVKPIVPIKIDKFMYVVKGEHQVSTKDAYANMGKVLTKEKKNSSFGYFRNSVFGRDTDFATFVHNDFELVVYDLYKDLAGFRKKLEMCGATKVWLTGSGSAHVVVSEADIEEELRSVGKNVFVKKIDLKQ